MSLVVRVVAPTGRDGQLIVEALGANGLQAEVCADLFALIEAAESPSAAPLGPLMIAEESLSSAAIHRLGEFVHEQPPWSDLPILILTSGGSETLESRRRQRDRMPLGSPILLERPIRAATLVSSVRAALRARQRQYQVRDALDQRDRAFADLRSERETLAVMLDNLPVGVLFAKASGEIIRANRSLERIFRHPVMMSKDIEAHGDWVSYHPDGRRVRGEEYPLARAVATGVVIPAEQFLYERGDGTLAWVSITAAPTFDEAGQVTGGVVAVNDIDQRKRASDSLRTSEERFRRLIENASVGILIGDRKGGLTYMNPTLLRTLGYEAEDLASGKLRWDRLTPPEYAEADAKALGQLLRTGTAELYQKAYRAKDGRLVPLLVGATLIPSLPEGKTSEDIAVFLTDLTEQKQAEAALVQSEKLAAVGRLAASISHEINNPLEAVINLLYLLGQQELTAEARTYLSLANRELARVTQIAGQTLRFHRQATKARPVTPEELLESVVALYQGRLLNSRVALRFQHRGADAVTCYEGDIRQVLNNLVSNAIDAMRSGGSLTIRTSNARLWRESTPGIRITIADTGHGMNEETSRHIFEAFYTTKGINGTGLGLWISRGIVEKHHGLLQVCSTTRVGRCGTVFSLFLPRELAVSAEAGSALAQAVS